MIFLLHINFSNFSNYNEFMADGDKWLPHQWPHPSQCCQYVKMNCQESFIKAIAFVQL